MKQKLSIPIKVALLATLPYILFWTWFMLVCLKNPYGWIEGGFLVVLASFPASLFVINFNAFPSISSHLLFGIVGFIQYFSIGYFVGWIINGIIINKNKKIT